MKFLERADSSEAIAYNLTVQILSLKGGESSEQNILDTYKKCLQAVTNPYDLDMESE